MAFVEENEISVNSQGGTEITKRTIGKYIPEELAEDFQIIPSRIRELKEDKIRVYWAHDLPEDPECSKFADENFRNKFHKIVFSSHWQMNEFVTKLRIPFSSKLEVIETPIEPFELVEKPKDKIKLIYFSTPHRGLDILVPVFKHLCEKHDNIHLDVFSSFKIYGWEDADKQFEPLYDEIRNHSQMTYHGFAPQEELRQAVQQSHILAFPSRWKETSCRVLMESMSAGLLCVHSNLAALPDTSGGLTSMYQYSDDMTEHGATFASYLNFAIDKMQNEDLSGYLKFVKAYADTRFNITNISNHWKATMSDLHAQYPTVESRKIPSEMFTYKTSR